MKSRLFNDRLKDRILKLAEEGKTMAEIAYFVGVSERALYNWAGKFKDFKEALVHSKSIADDMVEAALFQRATGYTHKETKVFFDSESLRTVEHVIDKHYPPDTGAAQFWLKNRDPEKWKDKSEVEVSTPLAESMRKARERVKGK